jgi:hypothetical protein
MQVRQAGEQACGHAMPEARRVAVGAQRCRPEVAAHGALPICRQTLWWDAESVG